MPIIRKIIEVGNSKVVSLPKSWLVFYENECNERIELVLMEINRAIIIVPYIPSRKQAGHDSAAESGKNG